MLKEILKKCLSAVIIIVNTIVLFLLLVIIGNCIYSFLGLDEKIHGSATVSESVTVNNDIEEIFKNRKRVLGFAPIANSAIMHKREDKGKVIYDVVYHIGPAGERITPASSLALPEKHLIFLGGSNTFGEGVNDNETLPLFLALELKKTREYNFAYRGYGPHQALAFLENYDLNKVVNESKGFMLYNMYSFHFRRVAGTCSYMKWAGDGAPYYRMIDDRLVLAGKFGDRISTKIFRLQRKIKFLDISCPISEEINEEYIILTVRIFKRMQKLYNEKYPEGKFYVLISPFGGFSELVMNGFINKLKEYDVPFIQFDVSYFNDSKLSFEGDAHLTPSGNEVLAKRLAIKISDLHEDI